MNKVLVTGIEPFDGDAVNPSPAGCAGIGR